MTLYFNSVLNLLTPSARLSIKKYRKSNRLGSSCDIFYRLPKIFIKKIVKKIDKFIGLR